MFNTTIHKHKSEVVAVTKEIEKTISPDKVTEMYDKIHEEVEKTILRKLVIESNFLNGVTMETQDRYDDRTRHIHLRFTLNGKEFLERRTLQRDELLTDHQLYEKVCGFFVEILTEILMKQTAATLVRL